MLPSASGTGLDPEHKTVNRTDLPFTVEPTVCWERWEVEMALPPTGDLGESDSEVEGQWLCFAGSPEHVSGSFPAALWAARLGAVTATFTNECCINGNRVTFLGVTYRGSCKAETRSRLTYS